MREIKFQVIYQNKVNGYERLKHSDSNIYWEWRSLDLDGDNGFERWNRGVYPHGFEYIRRQFTGLLDKHGKEIYEWDILKDERGLGVVYFYAPCFIAQSLPDEESDDGVYSLAKGRVNVAQLEETEIIGNIYENPNLINP